MTARRGDAGQLSELIRIRWRMVRARRVRMGLAALAASVPLACAFAAIAGQEVSGKFNFTLSLLAPTAMLGFAALAVMAPLAAGGGNELFPAEQLVAFPITPRTTFLASVAVAPINLAWASQLILLVLITAFTVPRGWGILPALFTLATFVVFVTVAGQAATWAVVGVRETRRGRIAAWAVLGAALVVVATVIRAGLVFQLLDQSPTLRVVGAEIGIGHGRWLQWTGVTSLLVVLTLLAAALGMRACAWATRRPGDGGVTREGRAVRRRAPRMTGYRELVAIDRASVWRSASLRRGALLLAVLPAVVVAAARTDWQGLAILPGLVAAGAGLLFGVNAFCLDASGAVWLASLPHPPRLAALAKLRVLSETCVIAVLTSIVAGAIRARQAPTASAATAVLASALACTLLVVATCLALSVRRPHRADLRGPRDTPAPPGAMATYSIRLAALTTLAASILSSSGRTGIWWFPLALAAPWVAWSIHSLLASLRLWDDPVVRARVVTTVASG